MSVDFFGGSVDMGEYEISMAKMFREMLIEHGSCSVSINYDGSSWGFDYDFNGDAGGSIGLEFDKPEECLLFLTDLHVINAQVNTQISIDNRKELGLDCANPEKAWAEVAKKGIEIKVSLSIVPN